MKRETVLMKTALALVLSLAGSVQATEWACDFTDWSGSDTTSVSNYTDTIGGNANSFSVSAFGSATNPTIPPGWLTQGQRSGVPTTAKFFNQAADGRGGRARFASLLPTSMDGNGGMAFAWTARYGSYAMNRAPIQLAITSDGGGSTTTTAYSCFLRVTDGTTLAIRNNSGNAYPIDGLAIPNVADGLYHQWSCSVITSTAGGNFAYWKVWLDGALLLFGGADGSPTFDPGTGQEQFSFRTSNNTFDGPSANKIPYIGLGELGSTSIDQWDFEFDCVAYRDEGLAQLTCGATPTCDSTVMPGSTQASTALRGGAADPPSHLYTITNSGTTPVNYTAVELEKVATGIAGLYNTGVDASSTVLGALALDPHWTIIEGGLAGACTAGAPCSAYTVPADGFPVPPWLPHDSTSLWITASPADDDAQAPPGNHAFRTTFTLANQAAVDAARIKGRMAYDDTSVGVKLNGVVVVPGGGSVGFSAWQEFTIDGGFQIGANTLDFTVSNGGTASNPMGLRVEFFDIVAADVPWLALDKSSGGPIAAGNSDTVTASIIGTDLAAGTYTAYVGITDSCASAIMQIRQIDLTVIDCRSAVSPATNASRAFRLGSGQNPAPVSYTFQNTGAPAVSYTVTSSAAWLQLDKSGGGPIASGGSDTVTGTINTAGLPAGGHVATLTFTDSCNPTIQHVRQVLLSVDETINSPGGALQQFNAEFTTFVGSDATAESPLQSCDPGVTTVRQFSVMPSNDYINLAPGWLTQGSIDDTPTTAKFNNPADALGGRARFRAFLPFDNSFDPAKGLAAAWRMRVSGADTIVRGPIQITFPRVTGPFGTDGTTSAIPGEVFNVFIRLQNGTDIRILNNGGGAIGAISQATLPISIADQYHQWTAGVCYNAVDQMAYWNLWIDGEKVFFGGTGGSVTGPGGDVFSFRTSLDNVTGDPYVGLGELGSTGEDVWDFDFDWVRLLAYNVAGCPFWDGEGCVPLAACPTPFADADEDHDVDSADFAAFQRCFNISLTIPPTSLSEECRCFDRNSNKVVGDSVDLARFISCAGGPDVPWQSSPGCE